MNKDYRRTKKSILQKCRDGNYDDLLKSECFLNRYDRIFGELNTDAPTVVELGIHSGASLRLWKEAFPNATVVGFDGLLPAIGPPEGCIAIKGSQEDPEDLQNILHHANPIDIVIDDCSHIANLTKISFDVLFPHVKPGGFYVIEDWGTGYWPGWPDGAAPEENHTAGMVGLVKSLVDKVGIPAQHRLKTPPSIHRGNWSTANSPFEYVTYYPGMVCIKKAESIGEPMHAPLNNKKPATGQTIQE